MVFSEAQAVGLPILLEEMGRDEHPVCLLLTTEEAEELLSRCLNSEEQDTPTFQQALLKLARASFNGARGSSLNEATTKASLESIDEAA